MFFQWDPRKAETNAKRHGVEFADAVGVFEDPWAITSEDPDAEREPKFLVLGMNILGRVPGSGFCSPGEEIRLISARKATKKEREEYATGIRF